MTQIAASIPPADAIAAPVDSITRRAMRSGRVLIGGGILHLVLLLCLVTMALTLNTDSRLYYNAQHPEMVRQGPTVQVQGWFGYDMLGRSLLARCLLGGSISLLVGVAAAAISVVLGVTVGLLAGYLGGWVDASLMRLVDILYGLPYILLVILFKIAFEPMLATVMSSQAANLVVLFSAIGLVSWLTMARVVRGQVLSLRNQPFIEAARAMGLPNGRIFVRHVLPNLVGPVIVYATLIVPQAILQESFLSFLGVGINPPMPTWGSLASDAVGSLSPVHLYWWLLVFPCILLVVTLLSLNFLGDGLRDLFDPKRESAKI
jgi:oligopeptide transport system permease protein